MLFEKRLRDGLLDGSITLAFRRWRRAQVVAGGRYRLSGVARRVVVESVSRVDPTVITEADARAAGFSSPKEVLADIGAGDTPIFRVAFGAIEHDPREVLRQSDADLEALAKRVARIEGADATLHAIAQQPGVRAADLMGPLGWAELHAFKMHVRRLKELGLTISLPAGYRLSPRGEAYLASRR